MIGWTLGRYFFLRYVTITFWIFAGLTTLIFIITFTEVSGRIARIEGSSLALAASVAALQVPMLMQQFVAFVALISGMATLASLNRKYELVVARAAGVSAWQFLMPICLGALVFGVLTVTVVNPIAAQGLAQSRSIEAGLRGASTASAVDTPWIKQRTEEGETIIGARTVLSQGLELAEATFLRLSPEGDIYERLDADRAVLRPGTWELSGVSRYRPGEPAERLETAEIATNLEPEFVTEQLADPELIPIYELPRKIAAARSFGLPANGFATHLHSMIALPALLVAMTLIAATVSMRFARMGQSASMILGGVLAGFLLYVVSVLVRAFGTAGFVPPPAAAWFPVLVASFVGVTFLLYKEDG